MNRLVLTVCLLLLAAPSLAAPLPASFDDLFRDETMRIDYFHTGAAGEEIVALDQVWRQAPAPAAARTWWTTSTSAATLPSGSTRQAAG
jgi:hypothetical protein